MNDGTNHLVVDLKIQLTPDRIPPLIMAVLMKHGGLSEIIKAANDSGMKVTVYIEQPGSNA